MTLTPLDVDNASFKSAFKGYDRAEVDSFRGEVMRTFEDYIDQLARLKTRVHELEADLKRYRENEELLNRSVLQAQRTSDDLTEAAKQRAAAIVEQARVEAERTRIGLAGVIAEREQFEYSFHALLTSFMGRLERANPALGKSTGSVPAGVDKAMDYTPEEDPAQQPVSPQPESAPIISIDMEDLTEDRDDEQPGDTVVIPMASDLREAASDVRQAAPAHTAPRPASQLPREQLDADRDSFSAAISAAEGRAAPGSEVPAVRRTYRPPEGG